MNGSLTKMGGFEQGLQQFNQLLNSKQFLIIFIRTLESQKNFSIRDRAIVASLLMIVLMDKMEYATEWVNLVQMRNDQGFLILDTIPKRKEKLFFDVWEIFLLVIVRNYIEFPLDYSDVIFAVTQFKHFLI